MNVLLVEDNVGDQRLISTAMARTAPEVALHVTGDGVEALGFLRRQEPFLEAPRPHFVLLDLALPRMSGFEVLREIKRDPSLRAIPVVVMTSSDAPGDVARAYDHQATAYFTKPPRDFEVVLHGVVDFMRRMELPEEPPARDLPNAAPMPLDEERFRLAVEASPSAMVMVDRAGRILMVNAETERLFGYLRNELVGRRIEVLVPDRFRGDHPGKRAAFHREPERRPMGAGRELFAVRKDGTEFPVEIGLNPIETPEGSLVLSAIVNITERRQAEDRFRLAVESSPYGVVMVDRAGTIVMVNTEAERMFGYGRDELQGLPVDVLVPKRFGNAHPQHRVGFYARPQARAMGAGRDLYAVRKDSSEIPVEIGLTPINSEEGPLVMCSVIDITRRKRADEALAARTEELARSNSELEQFASVASHDLQEPLRMVSGFTALLERDYGDALDETAREYIHFASDGATRMQRMIRDLLAYSRVTSRAEHPGPVAADLALDAALGNLQVAVEESGAQIDRQRLPKVLADELQLVAVFQNLVANAIKFRRVNPPTIRISAARHRGKQVFSVADDGIGIAPEHTAAVFQVFRQLHSRERYPGTGIGLAICKRIVERHGGNIWVESTPGKGTTFYFDLPAA